jgi:2-dehydro-3-deoxyglucarate aldolase/4-hydroxy-2-oxoheptanedioate aldolase
MKGSLRKRLWAGELLIGTIISLGAAEVAELISLLGFDWLFVDLEHSALDMAAAQAILQAASPTTPCLVRVPVNDEVWVKKCLDLGPAGLIVPQICTQEAAQRAVAYCKYPPAGRRGVGIARAHGFGVNFADYVARANEETALIVQVEHIEAVANIDAIVQVSGIDCVFVGPYDLSGSMGKIGEVTHPDVLAAISRVEDCCREADMPLGIFGATAEAVAPYIERGYRLIAVGVDVTLLAQAAESTLAALRDD